MPTGFAKIKDMAMLVIGAAFKFFDNYSDMALAHLLYSGSNSGVHISWKKADSRLKWPFPGELTILVEHHPCPIIILIRFSRGSIPESLARILKTWIGYC